MSGLDFNVAALEYGDLDPFGPDHFLSRLAAGDPGLIGGFPLLEQGTVPVPSTSRFMDRPGLSAILESSGNRVLDGGAVRFVAAGQQVGLLTGPLYTFLKAVTIIRLAADLERETGCPHLPLFWMASEDHDLLEVNRLTLDGRTFVAGGAGERTPPERPQVADLTLAGHRDALIAFVREVLPADRANHSEVHDMIESASFDSYPAFFRSLMEALFAGRLVFADPVALRPLTAPVLAALVEEWPQVLAAFEAGSTVLAAQGFVPPLREPGLFEIRDGMRIKVKIDSDGADLSTGSCSLDEAADQIRARPGDFSPNAALRPVLQDAVIPVSAMVGGPSELLYLWQIDALYAVAGVERARLRPRISATFLEPRAARAARKAGIDGPSLFSAMRPAGIDDEETAALREAGKHLLERFDRFLEKREDKKIARSRSTLAGLIDKTANRMRQVLDDEADRWKALFDTIEAAVRPGGKLQERSTGPLEFVGRHGLEFVERACETLDPWALAHQLVEIKPRADRTGPAADQGDKR